MSPFVTPYEEDFIESRMTLLLSTKLSIPHINLSIPRPHLINQLNKRIESKLTLISAPAGFGKTTLLSNWAQQASLPVAWLTLDRDDNGQGRFWIYFMAAIQTVQPEIGANVLSVLSLPKPPPIDSVLTMLINQVARLSDPFALVLDDYHEVQVGEIHRALTFLLDHLPDQMHLIIASRVAPSLSLSRLRARGQLSELRASDLRFSLDETASFFNEVMELKLSSENLYTLNKHTEGWITGLKIAALSMQKREDVSNFIKTFTGIDRYIGDYLAEEIINQQPKDVQDFLLQTSVLEWLTAELCDAVTSRANSQAMLEHLDRSNLFIVPLDDQRRWYRYHQLFAEALRESLKRSQPEQEPILLEKAAGWYEHNGFLEQAVKCFLTAGDYERAATLISQNAAYYVYRGEAAVLQHWLESFPDNIVHRWPTLFIFRAWTAMASGLNFSEAEANLQRVERILAKTDSPDVPLDVGTARSLVGAIAAIRTYCMRLRGNMPAAIANAKTALENLPEDDLIMRSWASWNLGEAYRFSGDVNNWSKALTEARMISQASGILTVALLANDNYAELQMMQGQLRQAFKTWQEMLGLCQERSNGRPIPLLSTIYAGLGRVLYEWNELDLAAQYLEQGIELARLGELAEVLMENHITLARARYSQGDLRGALQAMDAIEHLIQTHVESRHSIRAMAYRAYMVLTGGDADAANDWIRMRDLSIDGPLSFTRETEYLVLARVLTYQNRPDEAVHLLERMQENAEPAGRVDCLLKILSLQAAALEKAGKTARAMVVLEKALSLGEPGGYIRVFVNSEDPMARLVNHAAIRGLMPDYVKRLRAAFNGNPVKSSYRQPSGEHLNERFTERPGAQLIEPLSDREIEILRLFPARLSSREIANELGISVYTVRTHIKTIYSKLNAHSHNQAIELARAQNLLP